MIPQPTAATPADSPDASLPPASRSYSADELQRISAQARALGVVAAQELMARTVERLRAMQPRSADDADERAALLDHVKGEIRAVAADLSSGGRGAERARHRYACDALLLHRVCMRETCRKAQCCRGNAVACFQRARVPEAVIDWIATLLLAEHMPWLPLLARERATERLAYQCWIAGIEARRA